MEGNSLSESISNNERERPLKEHLVLYLKIEIVWARCNTTDTHYL
jgi:hypothetical protein